MFKSPLASFLAMIRASFHVTPDAPFAALERGAPRDPRFRTIPAGGSRRR